MRFAAFWLWTVVLFRSLGEALEQAAGVADAEPAGQTAALVFEPLWSTQASAGRHQLSSLEKQSLNSIDSNKKQSYH